jgi:hypothetical protein
VLTQLNGIDGIQGSSALFEDDGRRLVQIEVRPGATVPNVVEKVRSVLRAEVRSDTPSQLEGKSAEGLERKPDWLTLGQLNTIATTEEGSSRRFDIGYWLLALGVFGVLGISLLWLLRRKRSVRRRSKVRLASPDLPFAAS